MVDDLVKAGDGVASCGIACRGEERNLGFWELGVLGFRMRGLGEVGGDLE
jgi:hypothetical protein